MSVQKLSSRVALQNGTLLDPFSGETFSGDILIENGKIAQIGKILFDGEILPVYHYFFIKYIKNHSC